MEIRHLVAMLSLFAMLATCFDVSGQPVESARVTRDRAKADLIRAQEAFDRADESYINSLGGTIAKSAATATAPAMAATPVPNSPGTLPGFVVTFSMSGVGAIDASLFDYRGRLIHDEQPDAWTEHASGAKYLVPPGTRTTEYEVQNNTTGNPSNPVWKTICQGHLPLKVATKIDIVISKTTKCNVLVENNLEQHSPLDEVKERIVGR